MWSARSVFWLAISVAACGRGERLRTAAEAPAAIATTMSAGDAGSTTEPLGTSVAPSAALAPDREAPRAQPGMILVPEGAFTMGADVGGQQDEHPAHEVTLAAFWLDATEVTNAKWDECVAAKVCRAKSPAVRAAHPDFDGPELPVSGISWDDARAYCVWRSKRLPREAEFEKAVRGTDERTYPWGRERPTHERTVFGQGRPEAVGTHPAGRGPYGHDDLAGNVWEWTEDEYDPLAYRRKRAAEGTPGSCDEIRATLDELRRTGQSGFTGSNPIPDECEHSIRGGAYNYDAFGLRATNRVHHPGRYRIPMLGLRCAKDAVDVAPDEEGTADAGDAK